MRPRLARVGLDFSGAMDHSLWLVNWSLTYVIVWPPMVLVQHGVGNTTLNPNVTYKTQKVNFFTRFRYMSTHHKFCLKNIYRSLVYNVMTGNRDNNAEAFGQFYQNQVATSVEKCGIIQKIDLIFFFTIFPESIVMVQFGHFWSFDDFFPLFLIN